MAYFMFWKHYCLYTVVKSGHKESASYFNISHDLDNLHSNAFTAATRIQHNIQIFNKQQQESMDKKIQEKRWNLYIYIKTPTILIPFIIITVKLIIILRPLATVVSFIVEPLEMALNGWNIGGHVNIWINWNKLVTPDGLSFQESFNKKTKENQL
jgi:hypothetical protein